jgi:hypothetical protein
MMTLIALDDQGSSVAILSSSYLDGFIPEI